MHTEPPRLLVVDEDSAVLTLVGTGVTCLDVLRALNSVHPHCEAVLMTGYADLDEAIDALKQRFRSTGPEASRGWEHDTLRLQTPAPLSEVARHHIIRILALVGGKKAAAARLLGVSRRAFYRQLERHGLQQRIPNGRRTDKGTNGHGESK